MLADKTGTSIKGPRRRRNSVVGETVSQYEVTKAAPAVTTAPTVTTAKTVTEVPTEAP